MEKRNNESKNITQNFLLQKKEESLFFYRQTRFVSEHWVLNMCAEKFKLTETACNKTLYPRSK